MILAAWLLHSIRVAAALGMALLAMQAPAVTREYQAALLQLVRSSDQDIAQRKASAQRFCGIAPGSAPFGRVNPLPGHPTGGVDAWKAW
jgi:hypothetical protein